ncbi:MAG: GerMN domain-containing protein [Acidimicrobiia bacterium]|nr:GerMN domain-containing protein [Acidimicrobiia bacterium]
MTLAVLLALAAGSTASSQESEEPEFDASASHVVLDMSDPDYDRKVEELLERSDDFTIELIPPGGDRPTPPGHERRARDRAEARGDRPVDPPKCPYLPRVARAAAARAFLGCDPNDGSVRQGPPVDVGQGRPPGRATSDALPDALLEALGANGAERASQANPITVEDNDGNVVVHLPDGLLKPLPKAAAAEIDRDLLLTVFSLETVKTVQFTIGGDCLEYAYMTGGDICAVVSMDALNEMLG